MSIRNLNIAPRAGLGFGLLALMVFGLGAFALMQMSNMREQSDEVDNNWLPSVMAVGEINQDLLRVRALTMRLLINRDPQALASNVEQQILTLSVQADGGYYWNLGSELKTEGQTDSAVSLEEMTAKVGAIIAARGDTQVYVRADQNAAYVHVVAGIAALQQGGVSNLGLITEAPQ